MAISALNNVIIIAIIFSCSASAVWSDSSPQSYLENGIAEKMKTDVHMEGIVNGHSFTIVGTGKGYPYKGDQTMNLEVVKGAPLPFSYHILTTAFMYGNRVFTKYPSEIPDFFKQSFPEGYHWERVIPFEDQATCAITTHISLEEEEEMRFVHNIRYHCVNFPPDGPVMQRTILGSEPSTENMYPRNGFLEGYDERTYRLEGGGYYQSEHTSIYKSKGSVNMPDFHFIDHRIVITDHDEDYTNVELREVAHARYSTLPPI